MFIITNVLIGLIWLMTEQTLVSYAVWHMVSLVITLPALMTFTLMHNDGTVTRGSLLDLFLTVALSVLIVTFVF